MATTDEQTTTDPQAGYADASIKRVTAENGIEYAYRDLGAGDVPLVLLQHFRGNLDNWDPALIDDLAAERRRAIVPRLSPRGARTIKPHLMAALGPGIRPHCDDDREGEGVGPAEPRRAL